jgi:TRAP-type mannitol/chloroaromatic compound transport system permease small subunit
METLLLLSHWIDRLNERIGLTARWLVLFAVIISALNAIVRKIFNTSSNAFLEIQWYLFAGIFLLCAAYTLYKNEHVRIDVISSRFSARVLACIDIFGTLFFLLPMTILIMWLSWPIFMNAFNSGEHSSNAGGLLVWPVRLLLPIGFFMLTLQGFSELIKRIGFLQGKIPDPNQKHQEPTAEELLAAELAAQLKAEGKLITDDLPLVKKP